MLWLAGMFAITALLYASIGFGGGSTYTALLAIADTSYALIAPVSLCCNLIVVAGNTIRFRRVGLVDLREVLPYIVLSIPCAWWAGTLVIDRRLFFIVLGSALLLSALLMWTRGKNVPQGEQKMPVNDNLPLAVRLTLGAGIGFVSGLVGIGGGIFLAPCLHALGDLQPKRIAAIASVFIAVNSGAGLAGHLFRLGTFEPLWAFSALFVAVFIGGQLGSWLSLRFLSERVVRGLTSALVFYVGLRLLAMAWGA